MPFKHLKKHWKRILPSFLHSAHKPLPVWNSFRCFILSPVRAFSHSILLFTVLVLLLLWERNDDLPFPSSVFVDHGSLFKGWPKKERKKLEILNQSLLWWLFLLMTTKSFHQMKATRMECHYNSLKSFKLKYFKRIAKYI